MTLKVRLNLLSCTREPHGRRTPRPRWRPPDSGGAATATRSAAEDADGFSTANTFPFYAVEPREWRCGTATAREGHLESVRGRPADLMDKRHPRQPCKFGRAVVGKRR